MSDVKQAPSKRLLHEGIEEGLKLLPGLFLFVH